jgi:fructokinase
MGAQGPLLGGVELGGTKCVCLLGSGPGDIREQLAVPTGVDAAATLARLAEVWRGWQVQHGPVAALGIASFGPLDLDPRSPTHGYITATPKPGWGHTDILGPLSRACDAPVGLDTDVNGAALAEGRWGGAQALANFAYITVGTGVGVGVVVAGRPVMGFSHPELGHIRVVRRAGDEWPGSCPFHGDCVEGLAAGVAIARRTGRDASGLPADDPAWELVAHALGQLLHTLVLATAPQRILLGGGVMHGQAHLYPRLRQELRRSLNGYVEAQQVGAGLDAYVVPAKLGAQAGPLGALAVAAARLAAR